MPFCRPSCHRVERCGAHVAQAGKNADHGHGEPPRQPRARHRVTRAGRVSCRFSERSGEPAALTDGALGIQLGGHVGATDQVRLDAGGAQRIEPGAGSVATVPAGSTCSASSMRMRNPASS